MCFMRAVFVVKNGMRGGQKLHILRELFEKRQNETHGNLFRKNTIIRLWTLFLLHLNDIYLMLIHIGTVRIALEISFL